MATRSMKALQKMFDKNAMRGLTVVTQKLRSSNPSEQALAKRLLSLSINIAKLRVLEERAAAKKSAVRPSRSAIRTMQNNYISTLSEIGKSARKSTGYKLVLSPELILKINRDTEKAGSLLKKIEMTMPSKKKAKKAKKRTQRRLRK